MARNKEFDQAEVLDCALEVFWCNGYEATSMQMLVEKMNVNRQSIYDTFGDKRKLYHAALKSYRERNETSLGALFRETGSAKEALRILFEAIIEEAANDSHRKGCFLNNAMIELSAHDAEIGAFCLDNMAAMEKRFVKLIKKGQAAGEINAEKNARSIARFLFASINGLRAVSKVTQDEGTLRDIVKTTLSVLD